MKDIITFIVTTLVDKKDEITVVEEEKEGILYLTISAAKEDMGKIIGKNGKVIRAIRSVMKIPAIKQNKRVYVSIADSEQAPAVS